MKNEIPKIGDIIYIGSEASLWHGRDDIQGGKAKIISVNGDGDNVWIVVEEFSDSSYNWKHLKDDQDKLREKFGDSFARPNPDFRPEFNEG